MPVITNYYSEPAWYRPAWPASKSQNNKSDQSQVNPPKRLGCGHICQWAGFSLVERCPDTQDDWWRGTACCRCYRASNWYMTNRRHKTSHYEFNAAGEKVHDKAGNVVYVKSEGPFRRQWLADLASHGMAMNQFPALARWSPSSRGVPITVRPPTWSARHIGWHAGLRRARLMSPGSHYRRPKPQRAMDRAGVCAGPGSLSSGICGSCRSVLTQIEPHLFWVARGWPEDKARKLSEIEATLWRPGRSKDRVSLSIVDDHPELLPWA